MVARVPSEQEALGWPICAENTGAKQQQFEWAVAIIAIIYQNIHLTHKHGIFRYDHSGKTWIPHQL